MRSSLRRGAACHFAGAPGRLRSRSLMNLDHVQGQMELGGTLLAVLLAELVFLPLELDHLLMRRFQQAIAPGCILVRVSAS